MDRLPTSVFLGFPGGSDSEESASNVGDVGSSLGWENPLEKGTTTLSSILAWRIPWTEEPKGCSPRGHKESDTTELLSLSNYPRQGDFPPGSR